jgi:hypothetical protein
MYRRWRRKVHKKLGGISIIFHRSHTTLARVYSYCSARPPALIPSFVVVVFFYSHTAAAAAAAQTKSILGSFFSARDIIYQNPFQNTLINQYKG